MQRDIKISMAVALYCGVLLYFLTVAAAKSQPLYGSSCDFKDKCWSTSLENLQISDMSFPKKRMSRPALFDLLDLMHRYKAKKEKIIPTDIIQTKATDLLMERISHHWKPDDSFNQPQKPNNPCNQIHSIKILRNKILNNSV